jgi:hypothetical protein
MYDPWHFPEVSKDSLIDDAELAIWRNGEVPSIAGRHGERLVHREGLGRAIALLVGTTALVLAGAMAASAGYLINRGIHGDGEQPNE